MTCAMRTPLTVLLLTSLTASLMACDSGAGTSAGDASALVNQGESPDPSFQALPPVLEASPTADPLQLADPTSGMGESDIPGASFSVVAAGGLGVHYGQLEAMQAMEPDQVQAEWWWMQQCLGVSSADPIVLITQTPLQTQARQDDVLFDIDGQPVATAGGLENQLLLQLHLRDALTPDDQAYYLRSIMGRSLWFSAGLAERDYPHYCARR